MRETIVETEAQFSQQVREEWADLGFAATALVAAVAVGAVIAAAARRPAAAPPHPYDWD